MNSISLAIIIVNYNTKDLLRKCLSSIRSNSSGLALKTIVVDNHSKDNSLEMIRSEFPEVLAIDSGSNVGYGRANNIGISSIESPLYLFLNPDTVVLDNALERMVNAINSDQIKGALSCQFVHEDGRIHSLGLQWFPSLFSEALSWFLLTDSTIRLLRGYLPYQDPNVSGYVKKLYGTALLIKREVLNEIGTFDERFFMYGEDVDLSMRIAEGGWKLYYLSEARIIHYVGAASGGQSKFSVLMMRQSISELMHKYYGFRGFVCYRFIVFLGSSYRIVVLMFNAFAKKVLCRQQDSASTQSLNKYWWTVKWALGIERIEIAD